ncbi:MAG: 50S ribosomal protein L25 [Candidatus Marinimicrobia bacterium]|nr:50S ribosomal protein L25 [Candidatus Neomarinimicrobiota bacterium]
MAKEYKLEVQKRESSRKSDLKKYRKEGMIPGVYYSYDSKESIGFLVSQSEINNAIKSEANIFAINVGGNNRNVLFKSVQYHPVSEEIIHMDLYGVNMKKRVTVKVGIELTGDSVGIKEQGGVLNQTAQEIEVTCLPSAIPNVIEVDITDLSVGDTLSANEIKLDESLELYSAADMLIVSVTLPTKEVEASSEEAEADAEGEGASEGASQDSSENKEAESGSEA